MNLVYTAGDRLLLSIPREQLIGLTNALNEVCNGVHIDDAEFPTRLGQSRDSLRETLRAALTALEAPIAGSTELVSVWRDGASVQVRAISAFGDPVDMGEDEAEAFAAQILQCATGR
jgi:hypothetical protein